MPLRFSLDYSCLSLRKIISVFPCDCRFQYFILLLINWCGFVFTITGFVFLGFWYMFRFSSIMNTEASASLVSDTVIKVCNFTFWIYPLLVIWLVFISLLPFLVYSSSTRRGSNIREISQTVQVSAVNARVCPPSIEFLVTDECAKVRLPKEILSAVLDAHVRHHLTGRGWVSPVVRAWCMDMFRRMYPKEHLPDALYLGLIYSTYISVFFVYLLYLCLYIILCLLYIFLSILCICAWLFTCAYDC
jgi:hypothetical protein